MLLICTWAARLCFALLGRGSSTFQTWHRALGARVCPRLGRASSCSWVLGAAGRCCMDVVTSLRSQRPFVPEVWVLVLLPLCYLQLTPIFQTLGVFVTLAYIVRLWGSSASLQPSILCHISIASRKMRRWKLLLLLALSHPARFACWLSHVSCYESNLHLRLCLN